MALKMNEWLGRPPTEGEQREHGEWGHWSVQWSDGEVFSQVGPMDDWVPPDGVVDAAPCATGHDAKRLAQRRRVAPSNLTTNQELLLEFERENVQLAQRDKDASALLLDCWVQWAYERGGQLTHGGLSTLEQLHEYLTARGMIDDRGHPVEGKG